MTTSNRLKDAADRAAAEVKAPTPAAATASATAPTPSSSPTTTPPTAVDPLSQLVGLSQVITQHTISALQTANWLVAYSLGNHLAQFIRDAQMEQAQHTLLQLVDEVAKGLTPSQRETLASTLLTRLETAVITDPTPPKPAS